MSSFALGDSKCCCTLTILMVTALILEGCWENHELSAHRQILWLHTNAVEHVGIAEHLQISICIELYSS